MNELENIRKLVKLLIGVVFVSLAIISTAAIVGVRTAADVKEIGKANTKLIQQNVDLNKTVVESSRLTGVVLINLSDYLSCLIIRDEELYNKIGKDLYLAQCDKLLFEGTGLEPVERNKVIDPTTGQTGK